MLTIPFEDPVKAVKLTFSEITNVSMNIGSSCIMLRLSKDVVSTQHSFHEAAKAVENAKASSDHVRTFLIVAERLMKVAVVVGEVGSVQITQPFTHNYGRYFQLQRLQLQLFSRPTLSVSV